VCSQTPVVVHRLDSGAYLEGGRTGAPKLNKGLTQQRPNADFKTKMYQIKFRLWLHPDPVVGAYSTPPDLLAGFRGLLLREGTGRGGDGKERGGDKTPPLHAP